MNADLDNDIYKDDLEFINDQVIEFSEKDKLPFPRQEDFDCYSTEINVLQAPSIKIVQEGIFSIWHRFVRRYRLKLYRLCQDKDLSREISLDLKNKLLEPERKRREMELQRCYQGFVMLDYFKQLPFPLINAKEFMDFVNVMECYNKHYNSVNYLKIIRNSYMRLPQLLELSYFRKHNPIIKHTKESAISLIQLQYRRYKIHITEQQKQIRFLSKLNAEDLMSMLKSKIQKSRKSLKDVFSIFDKNGDGHIQFEEFVQAFKESEIPVAQDVLEAVFQHFDSNQNGSIQYMEFLGKVNVTENILEVAQQRIISTLDQLRKVMKQEFQNFEDLFNSLNCDDRLKVKAKDFYEFITQYTLRFSKLQIDQLFQYLDQKSKGYLAINEFSQIFLTKSFEAARVEVQDNQQNEQKAIKEMKDEIEDAKYLYHYIQAENMQNFIQEQDNKLLDLLKTEQQQKKVNTSEIDQRVGIYRNQLLKLEILIQQFSTKTLQRIQTSGLSLRQFFSQFTTRFPEKFLEPKDFILMMNMILNQVVDTALCKALFKVCSNLYIERISFEKYKDLIQIGQEISPIQVRMKYQFGNYVQKLRPKLLEEFEKCALMSIDLKTVTLRQCLQILNSFSLNLEMHEIQKLVDQGVIELKDKRYLVDYCKLLDLLFPETYLVESIILRKFGYIIITLWKRHKERYYRQKQLGKFKKKQPKKKPLGTKRTLKDKMVDQLPIQVQQNEYSKMKQGDNYNFNKGIVIDCVEQAVYFAESLIFTQKQQTDAQRRPTTKDLFSVQQFQQVEVQNLLGSINFDFSTQRLYLPDKQGTLYTQDVTANRLLQNIYIGTRIPFQKSFIVDCLIFDHKMFILKSNWQLQMWSMAQKSDRYEMAIDLREGMTNALTQFKHLYENSEILLVLSSQRTHAHLISSKSLHIIKTVNLDCCVDYHFKSMNEAVSNAVKRIIFQNNQKFPIKLEMTQEQMEKQEYLRREALNFINLFNDIQVQKNKLLRFLGAQCSQDEWELIKTYLDEISDKDGYISQRQFEEIFKEEKISKQKIWDALNIIKVEKPNLKQLFSTYDEQGKNKLDQKQLRELMLTFQIEQRALNDFVSSFPNGITYKEFNSLVTSPISYEELEYRCEINQITIQDLFKQCDIYNVGLLDRNDFKTILQSLPFGLLESDIEYLAQQQVYDSESGRIKYKEKQKQNLQRVHSLQYVEDLDLILFSVDFPKRGSIFGVTDKLLLVLEHHIQSPMLYYCKESGSLMSATQQELCIWPLYKELTFTLPPYKIKPSCYLKCPTQITSVCYLPITQLIVLSCSEGLLFYDPVAVQQSSQKVQVRIKPGYYKDISESTSNQKIPLAHSIELQKPISLQKGLIQSTFLEGDSTTLLSMELLFVMSEMPIGQEQKNMLDTLRVYVVHRQPLEIPRTQIDIPIPLRVQQEVDKEVMNILQQAFRSKRARGVIGIEKEINKEILKQHTKRNLINMSKQLIFQKNVQQCQQDIMSEIIHTCKFNGGLNISFIFNLLRSTQCLNPHNISFEEFKQILLYSVEYQPVIERKNQIQIYLQNLIREGQIDIPLEFEQMKAIKVGHDRILMRYQFKKMLVKHKAYSNEKDLNDFVVNDCVSLKGLMERFRNDGLIYKLRMIARPDQIVKEIQKLGIPKQLLGRLSVQDQGGDGILTKKQFMEAILDNKALYSEFFDLYSEVINGENYIRITKVTKLLFSIEQSLQIKQMLLCLAKIKNSLVYRSLGIGYLFKESELPYHDFVDAILDLKIIDLNKKDVEFLADCLAVEQQKSIPYSSFQHYMNKLNVNDQFLLVEDFEEMVKVGTDILKKRDMLQQKFNKSKCECWEIRAFLSHLEFEMVDKYLIHVLKLKAVTYDELIDQTVIFLNKINFEHQDQVNKLNLKQIFLQEEGPQKYRTVLQLSELVKEFNQIQKLYEQCMQFDDDQNGFIEIPIFCNIIAYNLLVSAEMMINFQFEWNLLTKEKNINYIRFFKEYANFELRPLKEQSTNLNQLLHQIAQAIKNSGINLSFALKRFYNYDNQDFMSIPQFKQFLESIRVSFSSQQLEDVLQYIGNDIQHAQFIELMSLMMANVAVVFDQSIWSLAGKQISLSTLNKLGRWQQSDQLLKALEFKRLFNQYDSGEAQQILRFGCVGSSLNIDEAHELSKLIRLNQADLSQYYVNCKLFSEAIPIVIQEKIREKPAQHFKQQQHVQIVQDDEIDNLIKKIRQSMRGMNCFLRQIAFHQGIQISEEGYLSRMEFKKLLDSIPYNWNMKEKHSLYQKYSEPINYEEIVKLVDSYYEIDESIILEKLFMRLYSKQITLVQFFSSLGKQEIESVDLKEACKEFMSPYEAHHFAMKMIKSRKMNEHDFLDEMGYLKFDYLPLLFRIEFVNEQVLEVIQEFDEHNDATLQQIQYSFALMGLHISQQVLFCLLCNYLHDTSYQEPMFQAKVQKYPVKQFIFYLLKQISNKNYNSNEIKSFYQRLQEQNISLFEFFAVCDSHLDYAITEEEFKFGCTQLNIPIFQIFNEFESVDLRVPFQNFIMRFVQLGIISQDSEENENAIIEKFAIAIKKLGNVNEAFLKLAENSQITYKSLKVAQQRYKLDFSVQNIQKLYLFFKQKFKIIEYKEFAQVMQSGRQIEIIHKAFLAISHIRFREYPDNINLNQLKSFYEKKGIENQDIAIIINSFDKNQVTNKEIEQKVMEYSNLKALKDQLSSEKIIQFCHQLIAALKGAPNNFTKVYQQHGLGSPNQIKYQDFYNFVTYLEVPFTIEILKIVYNQIDIENKQVVKSTEIESYLRKSQTQARVKTLNQTKKALINDALHKSIKDIISAFRVKGISYSHQLDLINLAEFVANYLVLSEQQIELLYEAIQDHSQIQRPTWADFAIYLLDDKQKIAQVFFKECLEVFKVVLKRLNIRGSSALRYFGQGRIYIKDFIIMMVSIGYNGAKLKQNYNSIEVIFKNHGGDEMSDLEFIMLMSEEDPQQINENILELLLKIFKFTVKHSLTKSQLFSLLNLNKSGWLSREELVNALYQIDQSISLESIRALAIHLSGEEPLVNVGKLCKLILVGGALSDNSIEVKAFFTKHYRQDILNELVELEQIGRGYDGLLQQITISTQDFFRLVPKHKEQDIALIVKSFGLREGQLDLEKIYECILQVAQDISVQENIQGTEQEVQVMERSVVLRYQHVPENSSISQFQKEILAYIAQILNQNQMTLMKAVFKERGFLQVQEFQVMLANFGMALSLEQTRTLIKLIENTSDGNQLSYTSLLSLLEGQGYQILKNDIQNVSMQNRLLQKFCQLDFGDTNYPDEMSVFDFYRLITLEGERHPFTDDEFQRLANLFTQNGAIQKQLLLRIMGTRKQNFVDENIITKEQLKNIFYRFNGFELVLIAIKQIRELFNQQVTYFKSLEDSGLQQLALQIRIQQLYQKINIISLYLQNDIKLIQSAVFTLLNNSFQAIYINPHLQVKSERSKMSQLQLSLTGVFLQPIPETQFIPIDMPYIQGKQSYKIIGRLQATNQNVKVTVWTVPILQNVCYDGISLKSHVMEELRFQSVMKHSLKLLGVLERKNNMGTEVLAFVENGGRCLFDVCRDLGGLLKIPQLVLSGQMIYVAKLWLSSILEIFCEIQSYGYGMPVLRSEILYLFDDHVKISELNGIQALNINRYANGIEPKVVIEVVNESTYRDIAIAPEFYSKSIQEITIASDTWAFGVLIFEILFGSRPIIISQSGSYEGDKLQQLTEPSDYESGDLLQREVFQNLKQQLSDIIQFNNMQVTEQIQIQLDEKSLGSYIKNLYKSVNTDEGMLNEIAQIIDLMCTCLQFDPQLRPSLQAIQKSGLLHTDVLNAKQIARPILNYKNPRMIFHNKIYKPSRMLAQYILQNKQVDINILMDIMNQFIDTLQNSIVDEQKLDLISYLFHSRVLDIVNYVILHINYDNESPQILVAFTQVFIELQRQLSSQDNPASQHVEAIVTTLVKFTLGEPYRLISDKLFMEKEEGFFQIGQQPDECDRAFRKNEFQYSLWTPLIYKIVGPVYRDMISESGVGSVIAIRNYIQLCTEKHISPFDLNKFGINLTPVKYNTIARTSEYYSEVISISDAQLQISNYLSGSYSKSSLKISINYLASLIKSNKFSKLQVLVDSRITNLLIQLLQDQELNVSSIFVSLSQAFLNEVPSSLRIEHSQEGMVQQYQQNNAIHLLRNLSIITHILNNSKSKLSNERFLSFQPTELNQQDQSKSQKLSLHLAESTYSLPSLYQSLYVVTKSNPEDVYKIIANVLQWPKVGKFALGGVTQQVLIELFRPLALQAEHKKALYLKQANQLYEDIVNMALPNTIELIHNSKVRIMLSTHNLKVPEKSSSERFVKVARELQEEWTKIGGVTTQYIKDQVEIMMNSKVKRKPAPQPFFTKVKLILKQVQAFVVYTSKDKLLEDVKQRVFIKEIFKLIQSIFKDILMYGQVHEDCGELLHALSDFIMYITMISPLLIFDLEDIKFTKESIEWIQYVIDFVYEFHIEWDRVNEEKQRRIEEELKQKQEQYEQNQQYLQSLKQSTLTQQQKNVSFHLPQEQSQDNLAQSRYEQSQIIQSKQQSIVQEQKISRIQKSNIPKSQISNQSKQSKIKESQISQQSNQIQQQSIIKKSSKSRLQESNISQSKLKLEYAVKLELRPYSTNQLIQCALSLLKCLTAIIDSNISKYLQLLTLLNIGTWYSNLCFKQWIIFERVVGPSLEETLIIKNQVDESMVRTTLFEAIAKCQSQGLQEQVINAGFIKGIFAYLLTNYKSFEMQKILKSYTYVPFIHWMPYRHEAMIYFTAIIWERKNCINFYNEMMIETHARNTLQEESCHLCSKIDNKNKDLNSTVMFTRVYMLCLLISSNDSGLLFLMRQLKINQKLMQLFQANEDFRQLFSGIYQYLVADQLDL